MEPALERALYQIDQNLFRLANVAEEWWAHRQAALVDPDSLGAAALWREDVALDKTLLGFSEWLAWQEPEGADPTPSVYSPAVRQQVTEVLREMFGGETTPEEIEALGPAIAAVRRGFESLEQAQREQAEGSD